jgi:outer membrane protein TolC/outer membrane protein OmpA-like peptidoglycan-associated protein
MINRSGSWVAAVLFLFLTVSIAGGQANRPVLDTLKGREWKYRDSTGEVSLGKVMTLQYAPNTIAVNLSYVPSLVQLSEALSAPSRKDYRIVFRGFTDSSGSPVSNRKISLKRAQALKELMIRDPSMAIEPRRVEVEGLGSANPVASNDTRRGRDRNRRVEIHIYGNVREAVRAVDQAPSRGTDGEPGKIRPAIAGAEAVPESAVPVTAGAGMPQDAETVHMPLFDAIRFGLESNQEIRVVSFTPKQAQEGLADAQSIFDPEFFADGTFRRDPNLQSSVTDIVMEDDGLVETGIRKPLSTGGSVSGALAMRYGDLRDAAYERIWKYTFSPTIEVRQPLLKNIGAREEKAAIKIANYQVGISNEELRRKVIDIATRISKSYWQLYLLREYVVIDRQNFEMADEVYRRETVRMKQGLSQQLDVERARSNAERRRGNLINAQERHRVGMDRLKLLINGTEVNIASDVNIAPVDEPDTVPLEVSMQEVVEKAMQYRPELLQAKQQVDIRKVEEKLSNHQRLPTLDVFGSYGVTGYGREFRDSVEDTGLDQNDIWAAGLNFEYPIGNRSAKARMRKTKYARRQSEAQVDRVRDQIRQDIKQVLTTIDYAGSEIRSTRIAMDSARKVVQGEFARFEIGQTTNEELLRAQDLYAATSRIFIRSVVDYNIALADLKRVQGELPEGLSIEGIGEPTGN